VARTLECVWKPSLYLHWAQTHFNSRVKGYLQTHPKKLNVALLGRKSLDQLIWSPPRLCKIVVGWLSPGPHAYHRLIRWWLPCTWSNESVIPKLLLLLPVPLTDSVVIFIGMTEWVGQPRDGLQLPSATGWFGGTLDGPDRMSWSIQSLLLQLAWTPINSTPFFVPHRLKR